VISSESTLQFYKEIRDLIQTYADEKSGKLRKKANSLLKSLRPELSLQDKISKVYSGYDEWDGLRNALAGRFGDNIDELAEIANEWRNELAHEKREYEPDWRLIPSMRLIEHINYCIVLKSAGFSDNQIKLIVEGILSR